MILNLKIENFRSIKDPIFISFEATKYRELPNNYAKIDNFGNVLKSTIIYGANASGKSNIIKAFKAIEYLIMKSSSFKPNDEIATYEPYLLDQISKNKNVTFEIELIASDNVRYNFHIDFNKFEFVKEELHFYPKNQKSLLYSRANGKIKFGEYYRGERKSIENKLLKNQLFISKAILDNVEILNTFYSFFSNSLRAYYSIGDLEEISLNRLYAKRLSDENDSSFRIKFNQLICLLDTGISKVMAKETNWQDDLFKGIPETGIELIKKRNKYQITTQHEIFDNGKQVDIVNFDREQESKGTQSLFVLSGIILDVLQDGSVLIVDEFERNLHPHITKFLIKLFHNPIINNKNAQLIFATHDISQLDNEVFRRDQIWFTEKDEYGATTIFSLADVEGVRKNTPFDKWYDKGLIGGTPIINELELLFENE